jgi:acylphosphatase
MVLCSSWSDAVSQTERLRYTPERSSNERAAAAARGAQAGPLSGRIDTSVDPAIIAAEIIVEGRVQGVGFRGFAQRRASQLGLSGFVMNLKDGRVRARAEGTRGVIEQLVRDLEKGSPLSRVERVNVQWIPPSGRFRQFTVRYAEFEP